MKNKAQVLNILLAIIIAVLVYQITELETETETKSTLIVSNDTISTSTLASTSEKKSVGVRGHIMPKPALVIGSYGKDGMPNMMAAAWAGICNSNPLSIAVSIRRSRLSFENIMHHKCFTVNVPSVKHVAVVDYVGMISGHDENKFEKLDLTPTKGEFIDAPYIEEFPIVIECEVTDSFDLGSHVQFIGKVIDTKVNQNLIKSNGYVDIEKLQPLIFEEEFYYSFGIAVAQPWDAHKLFIDSLKPKFMPKNYENATIANIHERKSVRHFTTKSVSKEQLETLVKAGMAAPTAMNKQPWAFIASTDRKLLDQLAEELPHAKMLFEATSAITVCGDLTKTMEGKSSEYWIQDCSAATQNILLAVESMGLGAVWTGVYPNEERIQMVKKLLNLPDHIVPLCVIPIGYSTGEDKPKDKWKEENLKWEKWGN